MRLNFFLLATLLLSSTTVYSRNVFRNDLTGHCGPVHEDVHSDIVIDGSKYSQLEKRRGGGGGRGGGGSGGGRGGRSGGGGSSSGGSRDSSGSRPNRYVDEVSFSLSDCDSFQIPLRGLYLQVVLPEVPQAVH